MLQTDPFRDLDTLFSRLSNRQAGASGVMPMDAFRRGSDVWVHIDLPGVKAESLDTLSDALDRPFTDDELHRDAREPRRAFGERGGGAPHRGGRGRDDRGRGAGGGPGGFGHNKASHRPGCGSSEAAFR